MSLPFAPDLPAPSPDVDDAPFWRAAAEGRLVFQRCADCGRHRHPPSPMCPACQSSECAWSEAPHRGIVFSYTVTHVAPHPALRPHAPYVVALVAFPELDDVRLVTNLIDCAPSRVRIGDAVEIVWDARTPDLKVPRARLLGGDA